MTRYPQLTALWLTLAALVWGVFGLDPAAAADARDPSHPCDWFHAERIVDFDFVSRYVTADGRDEVVIVDSRPRRKYAQEHIPGAISLPDGEFDYRAETLLPDDTATLLIFYCGGLHCLLSHESAYKAEALGYSNIHVYAAGLPDWKSSGGTIAAAAQPSLETQDGVLTLAAFEQLEAEQRERVLLVDVRAEWEYEQGTYADAINIPNSDIVDALDDLPSDRIIVFLCSTSVRANTAYDTVSMMRPELEVYFLDARLELEPDGQCRLTANP